MKLVNNSSHPRSYSEEQWGTAGILDDYYIVDFVDNSIGCHHITFSYSSIADHWPSITIDSKALLVDCMYGADERPIRCDESSAAEYV